MVLNIDEIVLKKISELEENKVIEKSIKKRIEDLVNDAIRSAFDWEFSRQITEEIKKQIGEIASSIKLNSYNSIIAATIKNITEAELNKDLAEKVQAKVRELLLVTEKSVKFSDIIKEFKEVNFEDDKEYSYEVTEEDDNRYGTFKEFSFKDIENNGEDWEITFTKHNESPWTIFCVKYDGENRYKRDGISMLKQYDHFECLVLKCLLNELPIDLDMSADDCEEELYQGLD